MTLNQQLRTVKGTVMEMNELAGLFGEEENELINELADAFGDDPQPTNSKPAQATEPLDIMQYLSSRGYHVHECHSIGHHIYPRGCVRIMYRDDIIRYADFDQLSEMEAARQRGFTDEVLAQVEGIGCPGPVRVGKPPIDAKGNPIVESNKGDYGSLTAECKWIEEHDNVFVTYMGTDENWPDGCYAIESGKAEPDYYDPEQIKYVAHELLGMPKTKTQKQKAQQAKDGYFAKQGFEKVPIGGGYGKWNEDELVLHALTPEQVDVEFDDDPLDLASEFETVNVVAGLNDAVWGSMSQTEWDKLFE